MTKYKYVDRQKIIEGYFSKYARVSLWLIVAAVVFLNAYLWSNLGPEETWNPWILIGLLTLFALPFTSLVSLLYRVKKGTFGSDDQDIREIVRYLRGDSWGALNMFLPPTLVYVLIDGEWRLLVGPQRLLKSIGGRKGRILVETNGAIDKQNTINAHVDTQEPGCINKVPFHQMFFW